MASGAVYHKGGGANAAAETGLTGSFSSIQILGGNSAATGFSLEEET